MKWSKSFLFTLKDAPADAEIPSHKLMVRAGMIRKVAPGIYVYGSLALRSLRKFERIVREELERRGAQEILMPMVQPAALWEETGRWTGMGEGLLRFENRNKQRFCLGATHEEVVTDYVRNDVKSYRDLPATLYQIQTKYRDEIRPRFGLMRCREFIMKDAYSFDVDTESALKSYASMYEAYRAIFDRCGLKYRIVEADAGNIGGSQTHEFQVLADAGEDGLMVCDTCDFAANVEVAPAINSSVTVTSASVPGPTESFATPGLHTIASLAKSLGSNEADLVKTMLYAIGDEKAPLAVAVLLRGSDEVNPIKLKNVLGLANPPAMLSEDQVRLVTGGASPGSCGPVGLSIPVLLDSGLEGKTSYIVGANRDDEHLRNVVPGRDFKVEQTADLRMARAGDLCPKCRKGHYLAMRGIEVGHVFYLGAKYSNAMGAMYLDAAGASIPIEMGCYGIGVSRSIQAAIEQSHDKDGIIWPVAIAPFQIHMIVLDPADEEVATAAAIVCRELESRGIDVFVDDRQERPGVKFKDADLLGMPLRIVVGARGLQAGEVELLPRRPDANGARSMTKIKLEIAAEAAIEALRSLGTRPSSGILS